MSAAEAPSGATEADATQVDTATFGPPRYEGDKRPPFAPGNTAAVTHGAKSPRTVQPVADRLEAELAAIAPWTASEAFTGARRSWAWAEAQAALLRTHVDTYGPFDAEGQETGASKLLDAVEKRLDRARAGLGLQPMALAKLMAGAAAVANATGDTDSLEALAAEGARLLAARTATAPTDPAPQTPEEGTHADPDH